MKKRLLSLLLMTALLLSLVIPIAGAAGPQRLFGDADGDEDINAVDVTYILRHEVSIPLPTPLIEENADVDGDGDINVVDATFIQRFIVGIIDRFPADDMQPTEAPTQAPTVKPTQAPTEKPTQAPTQASTEPEDTITKVKNNITVYFSNNKNWSTVNAYVYKQSTGTPMNAWPGKAMSYVKTNNEGEKVYSLTVDVTKYDRIIFNNGSAQTTDTPLTKASSGYFIIGESNGKLLAGLYPYGQNGEGNIDTVTMKYPDGGYNKKIYIWTPEGYDPADKTKKYSVLYMCDGQNLFGQAITLSGYEWECDETALSLMQNGGDGMIIVGIACGDTDAKRNHELTPNLGQLNSIVSDSSYQNGGGKAFSDFVVGTVLPYVESHYNTNSIRGIAGSSSGGIEAFYIGMENMDKFRYIGALSPAFILYNKSVWDSYLNTKSFSGNVPRIYFFCGNSANDQLEQVLYTNATAMEGWMKNHGYPAAKMTTVTDADAVHSEAFWALYFPEMLSWCLDL